MNSTPATTFTALTVTEGTKEILSNELYYILVTVTVCAVLPIICTLGMVTNSLNIITFVKIGFQDSVSVCFLALACSDFGANLLMMIICIGYYVGLLWTNLPVSILGLSYIESWYYRLSYDISVLITTFVAVQRGCCVAFPFQFKGVFTKRRTIMVILVIYGIQLACYLPLFSLTVLGPVRDIRTNTTLLDVHLKDGWEQAEAVPNYMNKIGFTFTGQILVLLSLAVITHGMRSSSKFRQSSTLKEDTKKSGGSPKAPKGQKQREHPNEQSSSTSAKQQQDINAKEMKVLKQVTLVSTVYVICNTPQIMASIAITVEPDIEHDGLNQNFFRLMFIVVNAFELINASINFFIYFHFNSKFKETAMKICCWKNSCCCAVN